MGPLCGLRLGQNASLTLNNNNLQRVFQVNKPKLRKMLFHTQYPGKHHYTYESNARNFSHKLNINWFHTRISK